MTGRTVTVRTSDLRVVFGFLVDDCDVEGQTDRHYADAVADVEETIYGVTEETVEIERLSLSNVVDLAVDLTADDPADVHDDVVEAVDRLAAWAVR